MICPSSTHPLSQTSLGLISSSYTVSEQHIRHFNPATHGIKTAKNTAFGQDPIQQTSDLFRGNSITVSLIRIDQPRGVRGSRGGPGRGINSPRAPARGTLARGGPRGRGGGLGRGDPLSGVRDIRNDLFSLSRMGRRGAGRRSSATRIPMPSTSRTAAGPGHRILFPEALLDDASMESTPQANVNHFNYAPSMASADSQETLPVANPSFGALKTRILNQIGRIPDTDFDQMLGELRRITADEQRYRWSRKAPMLAGMIFQAFNV